MRDYDLLAGLLAYQLRLVSAGTLAWYAHELKSAPDTRLLDFLLEKRAIQENDELLLVRITDNIVHAHDGNIAAALDTFGGAPAAREAFARAVHQTEKGWETSDDDTVAADELPHGLPRQIAPETAGRYTRGAEYARGGIGRILLVHDEQIGRDIILKELLPHSAVSPTDSTLSRIPAKDSPGSPLRQSAAMMARFLQEAQITGQLEHPAIVPVYELGIRTDGQLYYTMKLVRGETLAASIAACKALQDRLALLRFFLDICEAVAYAHSRDVIHRDLKPSNIMVGQFGECVVLDWGLAKKLGAPDAGKDSVRKTASRLKLDSGALEQSHTRSKEVMGTPLYMAPEQARGEAAAVAQYSDVYSLGVILYEILTGQLPHPWSNSLDTIRRVATGPAPPVRKAAPDTPPELAAICDKALQFHFKDRYPSANELARDIQQFLEGAVVEAYHYRAADLLRRLYQRNQTAIRAAAAMLLVIAATGTVSYINIYQARNAETRARIQADEQRAIAEQQRIVADEQRERAEGAEEQTARGKYVSDIRLADAYLREYTFQSAEDTLLAADPRYRGIEWGHLLAQCRQEWASIRAHDRDLFALLSPDAARVLTVSSDQTAKLWDSASRDLIHTWNLPDALITSGTFSPDGQRIAIWMHDGRVHLFDTATGAAIRDWAAHPMRVHQAVFRPGGETLVTASEDRLVRAWDLETGEQRWEAGPFDRPVYQLDFAEDSQAVLACPEGGAPVLLNAETGGIQATSDFSGRVFWTGGSGAIVGDGADLVFVGGPDLRETNRIRAGTGVTRASFYPDQNRLLTGTSTGLVTLWDTATGEQRQTFNFMHPVYDCRLDVSGETVVAIAVSGHITAFDAATGSPRLAFGGHRHNVTTATLLPSGTFLLTGSVDGTVRFWSLTESALTAPRAQAPARSRLVGLSDDGSVVLLSESAGLTVHELTSNTPLLGARLPRAAGATSAISGHGALVATALDGFLPAIIPLDAPQSPRLLPGHAGYISSLAFNAAGTELVSASWDNTARIWSVADGAPLGTLEGHTDTVYTAVFSPDGALLATGSRDETAIVWDRETLQPRFIIPHGHAVHHCAFNAGGTQVATAGRGGAIRIWDVASGIEIHVLSVQTPQITALSFTRDGGRLLSQAGAGRITVWDSHLGLYLAELPPGGAMPGTWTHFHPPTGQILAGGPDNVVREYRPLLDAGGQPIQDSAALDSALDAYRDTRDAATPLADPAPLPSEINVYMPAPGVAGLLEGLRQRFSARADNAAAWILQEPPPNAHPLDLRAGDAITAIANLAPAAFFTPGNAQGAERYTAGNRAFTLDIIRDGLLTRFQIVGLPVRQSARNITLARDRALELLHAARETINRDAATLDQVTKREAPPGEETPAGIQVPTPREAVRKNLLREAGLQANTRLMAINETTITSLPELAAQIDQGIAFLENNNTFNTRLRIQRGSFEVEDVVMGSP
ncbi:MAG: protein kinase [Candidatus Hydrogenedentes bacterium]|nr:protein kinase [Candidatus Hydrogenedentota bacterium]